MNHLSLNVLSVKVLHNSVNLVSPSVENRSGSTLQRRGIQINACLSLQLAHKTC